MAKLWKCTESKKYMYIFLACIKMMEITPETESHVNSVTVNKRDGNKVVGLK